MSNYFFGFGKREAGIAKIEGKNLQLFLLVSSSRRSLWYHSSTMILLVGASASGKTEIAKYLQSHYGIKKVVTHTTRAMRCGETQDVDYHFVTQDEFSHLKAKNAFVETTNYNGNEYGSSKAEVADDKVLIVDPTGLQAFIKLNNPRIITFFLDAKEETRRQRMAQRGDGKNAIESRIENDRKEFDLSRIGNPDFILSTDTKSVEELANEILNLYKQKLNLL